MTNRALEAHGDDLQAVQAAAVEGTPALVSQITTAESISGGVSKKVVGGNAYWKEVRLQGLINIQNAMDHRGP